MRTKKRVPLHLLILGFLLTASLPGERLPGTRPLILEEDVDAVMVAGMDGFALRELAASREKRVQKWQRDFGSLEAYRRSVAENRERFRVILGAVDPRREPQGIELLATAEEDSVVAESTAYRVQVVRWPVLEGVFAEGLLLTPRQAPRARVVALPDADWTPEMFSGLAPGVDPASFLPHSLASAGCQVLVPVLIDRSDRFSGHPDVRFTNQPHREWVYRQAFQMGRHIIGYEVQKVLAAVDQFERLNRREGVERSIGVAGVGEGGLLALYAAALDERVNTVLLSGYFQEREGVWEEPIYRNVWRLLSEFGDAEIAGLVAPRGFIVEAAAAPEVSGPPEAAPGRSAGAAPGRIVAPQPDSVRREFERARKTFTRLGIAERAVLVESAGGRGKPGSGGAVAAFLQGLGLASPSETPPPPPSAGRDLPEPVERQRRQLEELVEFTQRLYRYSARVRERLWGEADRSSPEAWRKTSARLGDLFWDEVVGRLPEPSAPLNARSRRVLEEPEYVGYEVTLDVYPGVIAGGILLVPRDLRPGERRPVVVCQHGLEGTPTDTITREESGYRYYKAFAHELAKRGFITYAPQNPYRGRDRFRTVQRKSNPLGWSLFSYILAQHQRTLEWLGSLPWVNAERIGFYGLSYGGKTAVRVPPLLPGYALSICSADFNEWILKNVSVRDRYSYMFHGEYEIFEWNMGHVANYAELASLMAPRPFMVERGHHDGVAPDEWVAWEYAKVRRHYAQLGIPEATEIEYFDGPHSIHGAGTYEFLHRHLNWPQRQGSAREDREPAYPVPERPAAASAVGPGHDYDAVTDAVVDQRTGSLELRW